MVERYSTFSELPDAALALFNNAEMGPFLSREWFELLATHCLATSEKMVIFSNDPGSSAMALSLAVDDKVTGRYRSFSNFYTPIYDCLRVSNDADVGQDRFWRELKEQFAIVELDLEPLAYEGQFEHLKNAMASVGFVVFPYFRFGNWYLELRGRSFDAYFSGLPGKLRNTIARKRKKLERDTGFEYRLFSGAQDLDDALKAYWQIYNASWKNKEPFPAFIEGLIGLAARRGWLRLGVIYVEGQPVAMQFWLVANGVAYIYKLAYDEKFRDYSPGSILSYELFKHAIDVDKVREIDYLVGDDPYKQDWMEARRERWGLYAVNPSTIRGRFLVYRERAKRLIKKVLRS